MVKLFGCRGLLYESFTRNRIIKNLPPDWDIMFDDYGELHDLIEFKRAKYSEYDFTIHQNKVYHYVELILDYKENK